MGFNFLVDRSDSPNSLMTSVDESCKGCSECEKSSSPSLNSQQQQNNSSPTLSYYPHPHQPPQSGSPGLYQAGPIGVSSPPLYVIPHPRPPIGIPFLYPSNPSASPLLQPLIQSIPQSPNLHHQHQFIFHPHPHHPNLIPITNFQNNPFFSLNGNESPNSSPPSQQQHQQQPLSPIHQSHNIGSISPPPPMHELNHEISQSEQHTNATTQPELLIFKHQQQLLQQNFILQQQHHQQQIIIQQQNLIIKQQQDKQQQFQQQLIIQHQQQIQQQQSKSVPQSPIIPSLSLPNKTNNNNNNILSPHHCSSGLTPHLSGLSPFEISEYRLNSDDSSPRNTLSICEDDNDDSMDQCGNTNQNEKEIVNQLPSVFPKTQNSTTILPTFKSSPNLNSIPIQQQHFNISNQNPEKQNLSDDVLIGILLDLKSRDNSIGNNLFECVK